MLNPTVVVASLGQQHAYQVALAAQEASMLHGFFTGIHIRRQGVLAKLVSPCPAVRRRMRWREMSELDDRKIVSIPYIEVGLRLGSKVPLLGWWLRLSSLRYAWFAFDLVVSLWLRRLRSPGIFHAFLGSSLLSLRVARQKGCITVLDCHSSLSADEIIWRPGTLEYEYRPRHGPPTLPRLRAEVRSANFCLAPSDFVAESIIKQGISPNRVVKIPYGADIEFFQPPTERREDNIFRALYVGRIDAGKGVAYLLKAWKRLDLPNSELLLAGPATDRLGMELIKDHQRYRCRWLGPVSKQEILQAYQSSDIFVFPSLSEGMSLSVLEAMACGLPCIVTYNSGSIVRDGKDGYVVGIRDVDALANRIRLLCEEPRLCQQLASTARLHASQFTWRRYRQDLAKLYTTLVDCDRELCVA